MILQEPKVGERNSRNTNHWSTWWHHHVSTFFRHWRLILLKLNPANHREGRYLQRCKLIKKNPFTHRFPELCQPSRSESYFFGPQQSQSNLISTKNPGEWTAGTWKNQLFEKKTTHLPTKPSLYDLPSLCRHLHIQGAGYCNPNVLKEQNMACVLNLQTARWGFFQPRLGNVGKKQGNLHGNNERWHGSLGQKFPKNHPGRHFYRLHVCTKKAQKEGEVFCCTELGCILLSAYKCEILVVKQISNRFPLHQALWDSRISGFRVAENAR